MVRADNPAFGNVVLTFVSGQESRYSWCIHGGCRGYHVLVVTVNGRKESDKVWSVRIPVIVIFVYMFPTCSDAKFEEDELGADRDHAVLEANDVKKVRSLIRFQIPFPVLIHVCLFSVHPNTGK
jgi:hypothetical protein